MIDSPVEIKSSGTNPVVAVVQARMTSQRLPGKVMMDICGKPCLQHMLERVRRTPLIDKIIVATTINSPDDSVVELCKDLQINVFRGDENDVLGRIWSAAKSVSAEIVVRLTADCPMIDPDVINEVVSKFLNTKHDYVSNTLDRTYPDGLDVEVMSIHALGKANRYAVHPFSREHVTPYISGIHPDLECGMFVTDQVKFEANFSHIRWTLDTVEDLYRIRKLITNLPEKYQWLQALSVATRQPELLER